MAGETTTTTKKAAQAAGKASDAENQAGALGAQDAGAADGQAAGADAGADAGGTQTGAAQSQNEGANTQQAGAASVPDAAQRKPVAIEVVSRMNGFWRGNRQWTHEPQTVPLDELTNRQLSEIEGEPLLITRIIYE
jgi:hypothetical protein